MNHSILGNLSPQDFLNTHWQKKPLLIRQAFPEFQSPIEPDELAGLALEEEVESRIVLERGEMPWELKRGPFTEADFANLPESHWTLLVQAVDHWVPEVHDLLKPFNFLPSWRLDDIMISYATDGGSVGPHYDQYDVFLIQAEGKRRWQIGPVYDASSPKLDDTELHILSEFEVLEDYVLEPGDMLYLPPGVGHNGAAIGDCMTISVGFRAPSHRDILMQFTDFIADQLPDSLRYSDADQQMPENPGELDDKALDRLQQILQSHIEDRTQLSQWFGQLMTEPKHEQEADVEYETWSDAINDAEGLFLYVNEGSRLAFREEGAHFHLFADGKSFECFDDESRKHVRTLCSEGLLESWEQTESSSLQNLLLSLINEGVLYIEN